jgi:signal peptidase II
MRIHENVLLKCASCFFILILFDQLSKYIIRSTGGFYICNKGIAFGIKAPGTVIWFIAIGILFMASLAFYKKTSAANCIALLLVVSGATTNLIDRLFFGCVIDFIDLKFWPIFNLADVYITTGAIIPILHNLKRITHNEN